MGISHHYRVCTRDYNEDPYLPWFKSSSRVYLLTTSETGLLTWVFNCSKRCVIKITPLCNGSQYVRSSVSTLGWVGCVKCMTWSCGSLWNCPPAFRRGLVFLSNRGSSGCMIVYVYILYIPGTSVLATWITGGHIGIVSLFLRLGIIRLFYRNKRSK